MNPSKSQGAQNADKKQTEQPNDNIKLYKPNDYEFGKDKVLAFAWELYETYSQGSQNQKVNNSKIRQQIIWLIFATSVLAVITSLPGMNALFQSATMGAAYLFSLFPQAVWPFTNRVFNFFFGGNPQILSVTLIILSVATTSLLNYASQFTPLKAWIMYRAGADRIRSEIYLYRMHAGSYNDTTKSQDELRGHFLERIEAINKQIYELETAPPFLQLAGGGSQRYEISNPRFVIQWILAPFRLKRPQRKYTVSTISIEKQYESGKLPGRYHPKEDNGFNKLSADAYLGYRVIPQRDWYVKKVYEDYERIKDWRTVLLVVGGASAVLAAIQLEPWIVVTTAAVVAINTHLQLNLVGSTYGTYHLTASRLDSAIVQWENLTAEERSDEVMIGNFVNKIEGILEDERTVWIQQASQAQKESEQSLVKGAGKREGLPSIDPSYTENSYTPTRSNVKLTADGVVEVKQESDEENEAESEGVSAPAAAVAGGTAAAAPTTTASTTTPSPNNPQGSSTPTSAG